MSSQQFVMSRAWPVTPFTKSLGDHRAAGDLWPSNRCVGTIGGTTWCDVLLVFLPQDVTVLLLNLLLKLALTVDPPPYLTVYNRTDVMKSV